MNDLKLLYINSNYKLEIKSKYPLNKDNIDKYFSIIIKHKEVIEIEEKNNLYYLSIKDGFKKHNLYYFSIKSEDVSFVEFNNSKIILKIKEEKEELPSYWTNYLDEKIDKKQGNDKFDGFLGYVNSSASDDNEKELETEQETTLEPGEFMDKVMDKIEDRIQEIEMKNKMKNMKFPDFGGDK